MKIYNEKNVYDATIERIDIALSSFDNYCVSLSGGKDSSVMLQLVANRCRGLGKKISVFYVDFEAQYQATITHIEQLLELNKDVIEDVYWICLPISLRNAVSVIQPKWTCWDQADKKKWVRPLPKKCINEKNNPFGFFEHGMEFEDFILNFAEWLNIKKGGTTAQFVGIRSDESLNRFRTIVSEKKERYESYNWTTRVKLGSKSLNVYNAYPLYDWRVEDIWTAVFKENLHFNEIYELMFKNGLALHEQRLCQPYGDDQRNGLDQFRSLEPETWEKVLNRVHGVNFGSIYARTSLLGNITSEKPDNLTWEQYTVFLLESLGIYAPELRDHYYAKIKKHMLWYEKDNITFGNLAEEADKKLEAAKKVPSWRRIARAIEKNDFWMKRLTFSQTKSDIEKLKLLKEKYANILSPDATDDKHLKQVAMELNKGVD